MTANMHLYDLEDVHVGTVNLVNSDCFALVIEKGLNSISIYIKRNDVEEFAQQVYDALMSAKRKQAAQDDPYAGDKTKGDAFEALRRAEQ